MPRLARLITLWTKQEIAELFRSARSIYRSSRLDIKRAVVKPSATDSTLKPIGKILIVIPAKAGSAPERNLIRRRIKSIFYENKWHEMSYNWVVYAKPELKTLSFDELKALLIEQMANNNASRS